MTTFAEAHAQRVAEFEDVLRDLRIDVPDLNRDARIDRAVETLFRKWTAKADPDPFMGLRQGGLVMDRSKINDAHPYDAYEISSGRFDRN